MVDKKVNINKPSPFTEVLMKGAEEGMLPGRTKTARNWFRNQALALGTSEGQQILDSEPTRMRGWPAPGRMIMFYYDPKHKKTLPYYDRFPLIFPLNLGHAISGEFMGLNMHYLAPPYRAKLMDFLYQFVNNNRYDDTTRIQIDTYKALQAFASMNYYKPCVKKYLIGHVRSRFISVGSNEWDIALFLDTARFEKASQAKVWSDSTQKIRFGKKY